MNQVRTFLLFVIFACVRAFGSTAFVNFETAPVHPIALSPDGKTLATCNLPDGKLEVFDLQTGVVVRKTSVPVGIDPVTVRFRTDGELWVVNELSDSVEVIDMRTFKVWRVISTRTRPADIVFGGTPSRAFVSCPPENVIQVFDPDTGDLISTIGLAAERPKALAVSPDGTKVYAAIFESGNGTTVIAPRFTPIGHTPAAGPIDLPFGPYGGINPPPNSGTNFLPSVSTNLDSPPAVSLIVKKQKDGRWLDDNNGDWTPMVSGTNAAFSGRVEGWDLVDHDVAVIEASSLNVSFIDRLMTICMDVTVNPQSGLIAVVGTDGINHVRYEPALKGIFTRAELALANPTAASEPSILDLNPHLDYKTSNVPMAQRRNTIGDPRGAVWNNSGTRLYVTGMGSDNVIMLDAAGLRLAVSTQIPEGPTGLAFDSQHNRLYVLCRFAAVIAVLDGDSLDVLQTISYFDPTPESIRKGRPHFYNTHETSGLGQAACASCHVDARFDRLAWDLGSPTGEMNIIATNTYNFVSVLPPATNNFHPMKGPMVTQTLQDIIGHEPFHWRGDRIGLEEFNPTFTNLQAADAELTDSEMQELEDFLATIHFPPNRLRNLDNSLSQKVVLTNYTALGRGQRAKGSPLPNGNAVTGLALFRSAPPSCSECHTLPTGGGPDKFFKNGRWASIPVGAKGEHHLSVAALPRAQLFPFKVPQLRSLPEKTGFNLDGPSLSGFGFMHDGRVDSLTSFLQDGFGFLNDQQTSDLIAFLISFSGSDLPSAATSTDSKTAPGTALSQDAPAAVGKQLLLTNDSPPLNQFIALANSSTSRVDLIAHAAIDGVQRGWLYVPANRSFQADAQSPLIVRHDLFTNGDSIIFMLVPKGTGERLAIDRDGDGVFNYDEIRAGSDPSDASSLPISLRVLAPQAGDVDLRFTWFSPLDRRYNVVSKSKLKDSWIALETNITSSAFTTNAVPLGSAAEAYFAIRMLSE
jgi:YVTN family beta-propeller protein